MEDCTGEGGGGGGLARLKENKKKTEKLTPSTKREPRRPRLDINVRRQLVKKATKKIKKMKSIKRFMTPLSIPLAAAAAVMSVWRHSNGRDER